MSAEKLDRFAERGRIYSSVVRSCPLTRETKEFDEELDTQERRGADPTVVEGVEQRREVGAGKIGRQQRCPIYGLVSLAAEKREVVAKEVRGNALDAVRGAFRRAHPVFWSEADEQLNERGTLRFQNVEHERDRRSTEHGKILTRTPREARPDDVSAFVFGTPNQSGRLSGPLDILPDVPICAA